MITFPFGDNCRYRGLEGSRVDMDRLVKGITTMQVIKFGGLHKQHQKGERME